MPRTINPRGTYIPPGRGESAPPPAVELEQGKPAVKPAPAPVETPPPLRRKKPARPVEK